MRKMTEDSLRAAFAGESQAHIRYRVFAEVAERERYTHIARLFWATAFSEQAHATRHFRTLGLVKSTAENLQMAVDGETHEVEEMYPAHKAVAQLQEEKRALTAFDWAWNAEKEHAQLYQQAKEAALGGRDLSRGEVYVCEVCGYTTDHIPQACPNCQAKKESFRKF